MHTVQTALLVVFLAFTNVTAQQFAGANNMTLFGHLNPVEGVGEHSSSWGYAAPDGREYGILGSQIGTHIIDVTTAPIRQVAFIPGPQGGWREMKTYGRYLYIVSESHDSGSGMQIVDLSELPERAVLLRTDTTWFRTAHTVFIRGHYLYAMGTSPEHGADGGVIMLDLEPDPVHPGLAGRVDRYYYHDAWERGDTLVGAALEQGFDIYDVRDRARPVHLANVRYPYSGTHNAEITSDGGYVVTSDEIGFTAKSLKVWDIRDIDSIRLAAEYTPAPADIIHNVHVHGRYVVASWYTAGVRIIDMIDPTHPREVAYYDTWPGPSGGYNGVWEVYPYFPSGKIVAGDRRTGLYVFQFNGAVAGSVAGVIRDATTGAPLEEVHVSAAGSNALAPTISDGRYYVGGALGDTLTISFSRFGYGTITRGLRLTGDLVLDVAMQPLEMQEVTIRAVDSLGSPLSGFSVAVEPHISSQQASGEDLQLRLPRDSTFTLTVGLWGYRIERMPVSVTRPGDTITAVLGRRYQDDATLNLGWASTSISNGPATGLWTRRVTYVGQAGVHPATQPDGERGYVFSTGAPPINRSPQESDVNGIVMLTSPPIDLRDHPEPVVSYDLWFVHYAESVPDSLGLDTFVVEISEDGFTWYAADSIVGARGGWGTRRFYPRDILPFATTLHVRFRARDLGRPTLVYAAVDNFDVGRTRDDAGVEDVVARTEDWMRMTTNTLQRGEPLALDLDLAARVQIFDLLGNLISTHDRPEGRSALQLPFNSGRFLVRATPSDGSSVMRMVIVL